VFGVQLFH